MPCELVIHTCFSCRSFGDKRSITGNVPLLNSTSCPLCRVCCVHTLSTPFAAVTTRLDCATNFVMMSLAKNLIAQEGKAKANTAPRVSAGFLLYIWLCVQNAFDSETPISLACDPFKSLTVKGLWGWSGSGSPQFNSLGFFFRLPRSCACADRLAVDDCLLLSKKTMV